MKIYMRNIIIIDWDDTLFPSTWISKNSIEIENKNLIRQNYKLYFMELDETLSDLLQTYGAICNIFIISNANLNWIKSGLELLPKSKKFIKENKIPLISARDLYSGLSPNPNTWKTNAFANTLDKIIQRIENQLVGKKPNEKIILNIVSIGDALYEYNALLELKPIIDIKIKSINLPNNLSASISMDFSYYLKSVKFVDQADFSAIIQQLNTLKLNLDYIINNMKYLDLKFQ